MGGSVKLYLINRRDGETAEAAEIGTPIMSWSSAARAGYVGRRWGRAPSGRSELRQKVFRRLA